MKVDITCSLCSNVMVMSKVEALSYIAMLKRKMPNDTLLNKFSEWCDDHEPVYKLHTQYVLYPLLRDKETHDVVCYMNQHGYKVSTNGNPTHPIEDYLGISRMQSGVAHLIEMQHIKK